MGVLNSVELSLEQRVQHLRIVRDNTQELGIATPVISLEIATLQIISGGVNFVKAITGARESSL